MFPDFTHPDSVDYWTTHAAAFHHQIPYDGLWTVGTYRICPIISAHTKNMGLKNLSKVCHIDKFWVIISMVPKSTSLRLSRRVSVAKLVKRSSSRTKQYMSVSNYFYFFPQKSAKKDTIKITDPKVQYWILQWQIGDICTFIN